MRSSDRRSTSSQNIRGSSYDRRARRAYLIRKYGSGDTIPCHWCGKKLRTRTPRRPLGTFEVDRVVCGHDGGRYTRDNIVPACPTCNGGRCGNQHRSCRGQAPQRWLAG